MTDYSDLAVAGQAVDDPATDAAALAAITASQPSLWPQVAAHPNCYPDLLEYLNANGDEDTKQAVARRRVPAPPSAIELPVPQPAPVASAAKDLAAIKTYLSEVVEAEVAIRTLTGAANKMAQFMSTLGHAKQIPGPEKSSKSSETAREVASYGGIVAAILAVVIGVIRGVDYNRAHHNGLFTSVFGGILQMVLIMLGVMIVAVIVAYVIGSIRAQSIDADNQRIFAERVREDQERVMTELHRSSQVEQFRSNVTRRASETQHALNSMYAVGVLYPDYRNFAAATSILQYLQSGRCSKLTGAHGAYNLYEAERRSDKIISQLDVVLDDLEQIKRNQELLYDAIQEISDKISRLTEVVQMTLDYSIATAENSEIIAYSTAVNAQNTRLLTGLSVFQMLSDRLGPDGD